MPYPIPSVQDNYNEVRGSLFNATEGQLDVDRDPFARSVSEVIAKQKNNSDKTAQDSINQTFAQTATEESFLSLIAFDRTSNQIKRNQPEKAKGTIIVINSQDEDVPAGTQFITQDGQIYQTTSIKLATTQSFIITSLVRVDGYAIATLENHQLGSNMSLVVSGVVETGFNGTQEIELLSDNSFRWISAGANVTATGTIKGEFLGCRVEIESAESTSTANKTFTNSIDLAGTLNYYLASYITFSGLIGGKDIETLESFKSRLIEFLATPQNKGNLFQHQVYIKQNTDANYVYFYTSEDDLYLYLTGVVSKRNLTTFDFTNFTNDELTAIKNQFITDNQLILGCSTLQVATINPTFVNINITITALSPNTLDMKSKIETTLKEYLSLLPINQLLASGKPEISSDKIKLVTNLVIDSNGNRPSYTAISVSGGSSLDQPYKKPILGTVTYS